MADGITIRLSTLTDAESSFDVDRRETGESLLKWAWVSLLLLFTAFFIPAARGPIAGNRQLELAGWQMAYGAHAALYYLPSNMQMAARRTAPLHPVAALAVLAVAALANWLIVSGVVVGFYGTARRDPRGWARIASRLMLCGAIFAIFSTITWFVARDVTPKVGAILWLFAPLVAWAAFSRISRRPRPAELTGNAFSVRSTSITSTSATSATSATPSPHRIST